MSIREIETERKREREKEWKEGREEERMVCIHPLHSSEVPTYFKDGHTEYCDGCMSLSEAGQAASVYQGRVSST